MPSDSSADTIFMQVTDRNPQYPKLEGKYAYDIGKLFRIVKVDHDPFVWLEYLALHSRSTGWSIRCSPGYFDLNYRIATTEEVRKAAMETLS